MASPLFRVRVEGLEKSACTLRLFIIHPDQKHFYATRAFALQLLWDPVHPSYGVEWELGKSISLGEIQDVDFVYEHQDKFVESVEYVDVKNYPITADIDGMSENDRRAYWENESGLPQAAIRIEVTAPKWLEHLKLGMEWETTAWNM